MRFNSIFNGLSVIWERDPGFEHRFLARPSPRAAFVLGKRLAAGPAATGAVVVLTLAAFFGRGSVLVCFFLVGVLLPTLPGALLFSTFSLIIACLVKARERFMGVGQALTMPLSLANSAIYPTSILPNWLPVLAHFNPLTFQIAGLRVFLPADASVSPLGVLTDLSVMSLVLAELVVICARTYPIIVR